jgi:hypothetical protein
VNVCVAQQKTAEGICPLLHGWTASVELKKCFHGLEPVQEQPPFGKRASLHLR